MADNNINRQNNRQPSMRELANERMRQMRAEREGRSSSESGEVRRSSHSGAERRTVSSERPSTSRQSSSRQIQPEGYERRSASSSQSVSRQNSDAVRRSQSGTERQRSSQDGAVRHSSQSSNRQNYDSARRTSSGSERARTSESGTVKRPQSGSSRSTSSSRSTQASRSASAARRPQPKKKTSPVFWIGLGIYTAILLVIAFFFLRYTDVCLKKYENSQSENFMTSYIETFEKNAKDKSFTPADFTFNELDLTFVDRDSLLEDYIDDLSTHSSFTAEKDPASYITEAPVYNITADGEQVARVTLKAISQTKIMAILTIMDWDIDTIEPVCSVNLTNYTFSVPDGYVPIIDGYAVDTTYQTGNHEEIPEFAYVSKYVTMPSYVEYKVDNVLDTAEIKVLNKEGQPVDIDINGNKIKATYASANAELSDERKNEALSMIQTYEDFNTDDLSGANHGLATVQSFLIKDSDYWNMARQWAGGVDITFTSAHKFDDPKYTNVVVDNYAEYSDVCYSLHIAFSKNMILTRTGEKISNDFDSTVFFVYYDDSDDNIDNPHWCIADMIATTK